MALHGLQINRALQNVSDIENVQIVHRFRISPRALQVMPAYWNFIEAITNFPQGTQLSLSRDGKQVFPLFPNTVLVPRRMIEAGYRIEVHVPPDNPPNHTFRAIWSSAEIGLLQGQEGKMWTPGILFDFSREGMTVQRIYRLQDCARLQMVKVKISISTLFVVWRGIRFARERACLHLHKQKMRDTLQCIPYIPGGVGYCQLQKRWVNEFAGLH